MNITFNNFENIIDEGFKTGKISLKNLRWIEPIGIAILKTMYVSSRISHLEDIESVETSAKRYISCILDPREDVEDKTYLSLTKFSRENFNQSEEPFVLQLVGKILKNARGLTDEELADLKSYLVYLLGEIVRNIKDHSESDHSYVVAQFYPKHKKTQIVIIDTGIGLLDSLKQRYGDLSSHSDAIEKATQPFVTRVRNDQVTPYQTTTNVGLGLYMSTELIKLTNNRFKLISGNGRLLIDSNGPHVETLPFSWNGTIVTFEICEESLVQEFNELIGYIRSQLPRNEEPDIF